MDGFWKHIIEDFYFGFIEAVIIWVLKILFPSFFGFLNETKNGLLRKFSPPLNVSKSLRIEKVEASIEIGVPLLLNETCLRQFFVSLNYFSSYLQDNFLIYLHNFQIGKNIS